MTIVLSSHEYFCWHEVGHVVAVYLKQGFVNEAVCEKLAGEGAKRFTHAVYNSDQETIRYIAAGGQAAERLLHARKLTIEANGNAVSDARFVHVSNNIAADDKLKFFGADLRDAEGWWPRESDEEFMAFSADVVAVELKRYWPEMITLVRELREKGSLARSCIEAVLTS